MTHSSEEQMRRFWNERAREDALYFVDNRRAYRRDDPDGFWDVGPELDQMLEALDVEIRAGDTVLEIGCGVGRVTRVLATRAAQVIALDVSDEMLDRARSYNADARGVRWILGDGTSLAGVADASVDACVSTVVFQHVPDPAITLGYVAEVGRVLRARGWAALQVSNDPRIHAPPPNLWWRLKALVGRAPRGQRHPAWLGSSVELPAVRDAARRGGAEVERVWMEGTQYCVVLLRKRCGGERGSATDEGNGHAHGGHG